MIGTVVAALLFSGLSPLIVGTEPVRLRGSVGDAPIRMTLSRNGERAFGSYVYERHFVPIRLAGTITADGQLNLSYRASGEPRKKGERFSGKVVGDRVEGTWTSSGGRRALSFSLQRDPDPSSVPDSWVPFAPAGCPVVFSHPPGWRARLEDRGGEAWLGPATNDGGLWVLWGRDPSKARVYAYVNERWMLADDASPPGGPSPAKLEPRGDLKVSRDQRLCRTYDDDGYAGLADCEGVLVVGPDFWFVIATVDSTYEDLVDVIVANLRKRGSPSRQ